MYFCNVLCFNIKNIDKINKGEEFVTFNTIVIYTYDDSSTKEVPAFKLKFSEIDTDTIAKQTLTITYDEEEYSFDVQINVVASEVDINSIEQPLFYCLFFIFSKNNLLCFTASLSGFTSPARLL